MSYLNSEGVLFYEENDLVAPGGKFSSLLNLGQQSISDALAALNPGGGGGGGDFLNVQKLGGDPTGVKDSTAALRDAFGTPRALVLIPPGTYIHSGLLKIAPNVTIWAYGSVLRLAPMARVHSVTTDPAVNNGRVTIVGMTLDGNDANQGDEAADGNSYDLSKGMVLSNGIRLNLIDVNVRHTRGHGINHWSWDYLFVRNYQVMQRVNPVQPSGGRRRDGITGTSRHIDMSGVSGYTADDLVAVGAGIKWGAMGAAGAWDVETVNITNVSPQVNDTDPEIKAWRGVALYAMNGGKYNSVTVSNVNGETKSGHVMLKAYQDAGDTGPEVGKGYMKSVAVSNIAGAAQPFSEFEAFMSVSGMEVDNLVISDVARQAEATSYGGGTEVPVSPTLLLRNNAHVRSLGLNNVVAIHEERGPARAADLVSMTTGAILDRVQFGTVNLLHPYATEPANVRMLRKNVGNVVPTLVSGLTASQMAAAGLELLIPMHDPGNGSDANFLTTPGNYFNTRPNVGNWPYPTGYQAMTVYRSESGEIAQFVFRGGSGGSSLINSRTWNGGAWSPWVPINVLSLAKWQEGLDATAALVSPVSLRSVLVREMSSGARQAAKDTTIQPGTEVWDVTLNKKVRCKSRSDQTLNAAIVWTDLNGNPV